MKIIWAIATAFWCCSVLCDARLNVTNPGGNSQEPYESEGKLLGAKRERREILTKDYEVGGIKYDVVCQSRFVKVEFADALLIAAFPRVTANTFEGCEFYEQSFDVVTKQGQRKTVQFAPGVIEVRSKVCLTSVYASLEGFYWEDEPVSWELTPKSPNTIKDLTCTSESVQVRVQNVDVRGVTTANYCEGSCVSFLPQN